MLKVPSINTTGTVTLNIGLGNSIAFGKYKAANPDVSPVRSLVDILNEPYRVAEILDKLSDSMEVKDFSYQVVGSDGVHEGTLVVYFQCDTRDLVSHMFKLSDDLRQDCIALWVHNDTNGGRGSLIGRYHYVWGEFNPEHFIHLVQG